MKNFKIKAFWNFEALITNKLRQELIEPYVSLSVHLVGVLSYDRLINQGQLLNSFFLFLLYFLLFYFLELWHTRLCGLTLKQVFSHLCLSSHNRVFDIIHCCVLIIVMANDDEYDEMVKWVMLCVSPVASTILSHICLDYLTKKTLRTSPCTVQPLGAEPP